MNTIYEYISSETKIACYTNDIAILNTNSDLSTSEIILHTNLTNVETWASILKILINPEKSNLCVFPIDRKKQEIISP